jgi:phage terminase large subunit GpA-like protein
MQVARRSATPIPHARAHFYAVLSRAIAPRPITTVSSWADKYRILTSKSSGEVGQWRTDRTPYLREVMDSLSSSHAAQRIVLMFAAQLGKTEAAMNWIGYVIHHSPAPMLVVVPTLEVRKRWVRQRLDPLLNENPVIRALMDGRRQRDAGNSEDMKDFPGGMLVLGGANSPASLSSMPIQYVVCDEVDRFPWEVAAEGDPLGLVDERTKTFPRRKVLLVSTPTVKGSSRIEGEYLRSDMRQYHVPCPHCQEFQVLAWKHPDGRYGLTYLPASKRVVYNCMHCGADIEEHHKPAMLERGQWIPRHPERATRGYQLSGLYSPLGLGFSWAELWAKWQDCHGDTANLKRFVNTTLAETWTEAGDNIEDIALISRLEDYPDTLPLLARTAFVDVQKDRLEMTVIDWGVDEESWAHDHIILPGDTATQDVWDALSDELEGLHLDALGIDSGYNATQVYAFVAGKKWAYATKGIPGMQRPIAEDEKTRRQRLRKKNKRKVVVEPIGVDNAKALLYARLKQDKPGKGTVHFPRRPAFDDEYFSQVAAEKLVTKMHGTRPHQEWVQTRPRNEALDCLVGNLAVLRIGVKLGELAERAARGEVVHKATAHAAQQARAPADKPDAPLAAYASPARTPIKPKTPPAPARMTDQPHTQGWEFERRN